MNATANLLLAGCFLAAPVPKELSKSNTVVLETTSGSIEIELLPEKAPKSVANFLKYADDKFYDDLTFHRVIPNFMIQGGGYDAKMAEKKGRAPIVNESDNGLSNVRGTVVMARAAASDSATSQFFINLKDNVQLDGSDNKPGYCVFGKVVKGMDVVDKIAGVTTGRVGILDNVPTEPVILKTVRRR
jgi:peptidyl-prolyl cis-trans isomerase A (cyclophilin A)